LTFYVSRETFFIDLIFHKSLTIIYTITA